VAARTAAQSARGGAERPRRRGGEPATVAAVSAGEKVGEEEEKARNLTVHSNRAKEGRERELDERGRSSNDGNGGRGGLDVDLAVERLKRAHERAPWVRGEAVQLGARGIEAERRVWPARTPAAACSGSARPVREEGEREGEKRTQFPADKAGRISTMGEVRRRDAWRARRRPMPVRRGERTVNEQRKHSEVSMNFDPTLTIQNSKFHIGT